MMKNHAPIDIESNFALACFSEQQGLINEAFALYQDILLHQPNHLPSAHNLAILLYRQGRFVESAQRHWQTLKQHPSHVASWLDLALALIASGKPTEARQVLDEANKHFPNSREARFALGLLALRQHDWATGWPAYEARWQKNELAQRIPADCLRWDGKPISHGRLHILPEQGFGDVLMFSRYLNAVSARSHFISFTPDPALLALFRHSFPHVDVAGTYPPQAGDVCLPVASLPLMLLPEISEPPRALPYLKADLNALSAEQQSVLTALPKSFIGLVWRGNQKDAALANRSLALDDVLPAIPPEFKRPYGVISLQKDPSPAEIARLDAEGILDLSPMLTDFNATAAVLEKSDGLLTIDTASAHLAGALGKPIILLQRPEGDWRWGLDHRGTAWYRDVHAAVIQRSRR